MNRAEIERRGYGRTQFRLKLPGMPDPKISVFLADDNRIVREGVRAAPRSDAGLRRRRGHPDQFPARADHQLAVDTGQVRLNGSMADM